METKSKVLTFIGFSVKSRNVVCGVNAVSTIKNGKAKLLIMCSTASLNTIKDIEKLSLKFKAKIIISEMLLSDVIGKENCKLIALTDEGLSKAVLEHLDGHFTEYSGGNDR